MSDKNISLLLDLQQIKMQVKGTGYELWARSFNLEQLTKTIPFINKNLLTNHEDLKIENDKILNQ